MEGGSPLQGTIAYMAPELIKNRNVALNGKVYSSFFLSLAKTGYGGSFGVRMRVGGGRAEVILILSLILLY